MDPETEALNTEDSPSSGATIGINPGDSTPAYDAGDPAATTTGTPDGPADEPAHEQYVPYDRFAEVNQKYRDLEAKFTELEPKAKLAEANQDFLKEIEAFGGPDQFRQALAAAQAEQAQAAQEAREAEIQSAAEKMIEDGHISPEVAPQFIELMKLKDRLEPVAQTLEEQRWQQQVEAGVNQLKTSYPDMDESFVRLAMQSGDDPVAAARASHERTQQIIARHTAQREAALGTIPPTPGGGTGAAPAPSQPAIPDPSDRDAFAKYMAGIEAGFTR